MDLNQGQRETSIVFDSPIGGDESYQLILDDIR